MREKKNKRICIIDYDFTVQGGAEAVSIDIANAFADSYNVFLLGIRGSNSEPSYEMREDIIYDALCVSGRRFRELLVNSYKGIEKFIKENQIDIVLTIGSVTSFIVAPQMIRFPKVRFVFCDHGALVNEWDDKEIRMMRRIASKLADRTVVLTNRTRQDYIRLFKRNPKKILCIPNWMNPRFINSKTIYNPDSKSILSIGRFGPEKGYDMLVDVAEQVFHLHPDWSWHIYGDGETHESIRELIRQRKMEHHIILHGSTTQPEEVYKNQAMLVLPSYREGLPLVLLEAKANKLPCVSFDVLTGPREIIRDGENGFLIPMYDKEEMANRICMLIENPIIRQEFSQKSILDIDKFEKNSILRKWTELLENI